MLTILVALSACGGGKGDAAGEVPPVCQEARQAFNDWLHGAQDMEEAASKMVEDSAGINFQLSGIILTGDTSGKKRINGLIAELNVNGKVAQQKVVKASELYAAFSSLFKACRAVKGVTLPLACVDEMRQYPAVTAAQTKLMDAQIASLKNVTASRTAMIARDKRAEAAADKQETASRAQLKAATKSWNDTVLPKYDSAIKACSKVIS